MLAKAMKAAQRFPAKTSSEQDLKTVQPTPEQVASCWKKQNMRAYITLFCLVASISCMVFMGVAACRRSQLSTALPFSLGVPGLCGREGRVPFSPPPPTS